MSTEAEASVFDEQWKREDRKYHEKPSVAETYDRRVARFYELDHKHYTLEPWKRAVLAAGASPDNDDDRVLDFGCGTGHGTLSFADAGFNVVSLDASFAMLRRVQAKARQRGLKVACVLADGDRLPFRDGTFAAVICTGVLHHMPDPSSGVASQARVIRPGGQLFVSEPYGVSSLLSLPGNLLFAVARWVRDWLRGGGAQERLLDRAELDSITAELDSRGFQYEVDRFSYWPYACGYLPESVAWPLMKFINRFKTARTGDAVKIEAVNTADAPAQ